MRLLLSNTPTEYSKKIYVKHWIKVCILLIITSLLTWYGKFHKPAPMLTYRNDFGVWIIPHKNGLGALVALPNDNNDSNKVSTGLRIWLSPPDSLLAFERLSAVRYRGKNIVAIGDSLSDHLKQDLLSTLDSNGSFYWLGLLNTELTGEDVFTELKIFNFNPQDYILDIIYEGYKLRFFGSQSALDSLTEEPLSVAVLMFKPTNESEPPFKNNKQIQSLIWNGKNEKEASSSSRIALNYEEAMAIISFNKKNGLAARRMYLNGWNPNY
jgi:hypothetical protein